MEIQPIETSQEPIKANQEQFIKHFNEKGVPMISTPQVYQIVKEGNTDSIRRALEHYLVTSSRVDRKNNQIIHHAESKWEYNIKVKIPTLNGDFKENKEIETYLQALFDTKDDFETIVKVLKSSKKEIIRLWTSSNEESVRAVRLYFYEDRFFVVADDGFTDDVGYSHSVSVNTEAKPKSIINPKKGGK